MLQVIINGKPKEIRELKNIFELLQDSKINPRAVVVEINNSLIQQEKWPETILNQGDIIEIISFMGGG